MEEDNSSEERPPILGSWNKIYLVVLGNLAFLIIIFILLTRYFS